MIDLSRRRRRPRKRRAPSREWGVLSFPPNDDGPTHLFGPFTLQCARAVLLTQSDTGRKVQRVPYERVRALQEAIS